MRLLISYSPSQHLAPNNSFKPTPHRGGLTQALDVFGDFMNDSRILAARLEDLAKLASIAETDFEKAAVYAATRAIVAQFEESEDEFDGYLLEKITAAAWHINAAIGYDIDNGQEIGRAHV